MNETTTTQKATSTVDRAAIRAELEATRAAFHELVAQIGDAQWKTRSANPAWTCGQIAWHLASGTAFMAGLAANARKGKGTNPPAFLLGLVFKASEMRVKFASRKGTPASVVADYDEGTDKIMAALDATDDADFAKSATNFGQTRTVAETLRMPAEHFAEHGPEVRTALGIGTSPAI